MHIFRSVVPFAVAAVASFAVSAANLTAAVTDKTGKPLPGAVVTLEPESGKLPVKPLAGIEISQVRKAFSPDVSVVTLGTAVTFPNRDTVRHHVYSFSPARTFELKLYAGTPSAPIVFDKAGVAVIGCNIHDQMTAWVVIVDTPYYTRSVADGSARIEGVAAGTYRLRTWHPGLAEGSTPPFTVVRVGASDVEQAVRLDVLGALP